MGIAEKPADLGGPLVDTAVTLAPDLKAPAVARQLLQRHLVSVPEPVVDDALLLVSELVTNAVRYGRQTVELRLLVTPNVVRIEVRDDSDVIPQLSDDPPGLEEPGGRGPFIVAALATSWGVAPRAGQPGKTVWFELAHP